MFLLFPSSISYQGQGGPLQSFAWSLSMACQLLTGQFWSLALSPLPVVYQVCVSVLFGSSFFLLSPLTFKCPSLAILNEAGTVTLHIPLL